MTSKNQMINIGGDAHDRYHRYKRSRIEICYHRKNNGKTVIKNMETIAKQLKVGPKFITEFYKKIKKSGYGMIEEHVFKGILQVPTLEKILQKMIIKFILCPKCKLPELDEKGSCKACSYSDHKKKKGHKKKDHISSEHELKRSVSDMTATMNITSDKVTIDIASIIKKLYERRDSLLSQGASIEEIDLQIDHEWKAISKKDLHNFIMLTGLEP